MESISICGRLCSVCVQAVQQIKGRKFLSRAGNNFIPKFCPDLMGDIYIKATRNEFSSVHCGT